MCYLRIFLIMLLFFRAFASPLGAEFVFLKDGSIKKGTITGDSAESIRLRSEEGGSDTIKRSDIIRILYTELNMGKILVQKKDGTSFTAYMVDEDRESYTFRNDLYKPVEFKVKRLDVLFLAERNPSGLKGEADTGSISLTWFVPYDKMESYNIYTKKNKKDKYEIAATCPSNKYTLKKLPSNTRYFIVVTGVDANGEETPYSNEIEITTKNILPGPAERARYTLNEKGDMNITWLPATDPDGKIVKYKIYGLAKKENKLVGDTSKTAFTLKAGSDYDEVTITAVDDKGGESDSIQARLAKGPDQKLALYPGVILPLGKFGTVAGLGYGGTVRFEVENYIADNLILGAETGFYNFTGADALDTENKKVESLFIVPFMLTAGYRFHFTENLSAAPYINAGAMYLSSEFIARDEVTYFESERTLYETGPAAEAGIMAAYMAGDSFALSLRISLGMLIGTDEGMYAGCGLGVVYRF